MTAKDAGFIRMNAGNYVMITLSNAINSQKTLNVRARQGGECRAKDVSSYQSTRKAEIGLSSDRAS